MNTRSLVRRSTALAFALAVAFLARAPRATAADDVLRDEWQVLEMGGAKVGYEHKVVRRLANPARVETRVESKLVLGRLDAAVEMTSDETTVEGEDGRPLSIHAKAKQSAVETVTDIAFEGKSAKVATETMGTKREASVEVPEDIVGPWRADRIPLEAGFPAGKTFETKQFVRDVGGAVTFRTVVVGPEQVDLPGGGKGSLVRLDAEIEALGMKGTAWVDREGVTIRERLTVAGMTFDGHKATKEEALSEGDPSKPAPDLFLKSLIASKVLIPHARAIEAATLRIRSRGPDTKIPDLASDRQTVVRKEEKGALVVAVKRTVPPEGAATRPIASPAADLAPFLAPSSMIQSDDPMIQKAAADAVGEEKDAWKAAQAIERWVFQNLTKKGMGVGFASASEVCKNREGDCTEHAVLAAALCRAAGIPSRVVMGLEYLQGIWGGHAWTEAFVAGHWHAIDATNARGSVDALHLTLVATPLAEGAVGKETAVLGGVVGSVDIDVLDATWNGRVLPVGDPAAVRVEGRRYENRLYDLAFEVPEGFAVEAIVPKGPEERLAKLTGKDPAGTAVEIVVSAGDLPPAGAKRPSHATDAAVDARAAWSLSEKDGTRDVLVVVGDEVLVFHASPAGEVGEKALDALLATVDLDPLPPPGR